MTTVAELIAAVGDDPGHSARFYASTASSVNALKLRKLADLVGRGILEDRPGIVKGCTASRLYLTPLGMSIYGLLTALRAIPD